MQLILYYNIIFTESAGVDISSYTNIGKHTYFVLNFISYRSRRAETELFRVHQGFPQQIVMFFYVAYYFFLKSCA